MAKKIALRKCIGCGQIIEKNNMLRIVKQKDGAILADPTGRLNGRGAYIHKDSKCIENAIKTKAIDRTFKVKVAPEVYKALKEEVINIET